MHCVCINGNDLGIVIHITGMALPPRKHLTLNKFDSDPFWRRHW